MTNIVVPQLGESVVEARVARWLKKEGDHVETGEAVVELETDKIDVEVGADHAGTLSSIKHGEGDDVKVGELLATVDESSASKPAAAPAPAPSGAGAAVSGNGSENQDAPPADAPRATPTARRIATDHKIDLEDVEGSGSAGRVTKRDVQKAVPLTSEPRVAPTAESKIAPAREARVAP